jgi:hypothetical protein
VEEKLKEGKKTHFLKKLCVRPHKTHGKVAFLPCANIKRTTNNPSLPCVLRRRTAKVDVG